MMLRNRFVAAIALLIISMLPLRAQEPSQPKPFARARLEPGTRVTVGQPVTVVVEILVPTWFTGAPRFPELDVADAIAVFEDRGTNFTERIDNQTWAGQSRQYHIYPQRPGAYVIAAIPIRVRYNAEGIGSREATVSPREVRFEARIPPEAADLPYFISTTDLRLEQSFDREPASLKVGDAFTRTITVTVNDALSMVLPPIPADPVPGLAVYPDPPRVTDEGGERGERIVGTRVERATIVAEQEGDYILPAIELAWWDVEAKRLRTATLPAVEFHVEPNPDLVADIPFPQEDLAEEKAEAVTGPRVSVLELLRRWSVPFAALGLILLLLFGLWRRYAPAARQRLGEARSKHRESESAYFSAFRSAARRGDPVATWNRWTAWLDRAHTGPGAATIRAFVEGTTDAGLEAETEALDAALFAENRGDRGDWSGTALYRSVARIRRRRARARSGSAQEPLASLNP